MKSSIVDEIYKRDIDLEMIKSGVLIQSGDNPPITPPISDIVFPFIKSYGRTKQRELLQYLCSVGKITKLERDLLEMKICNSEEMY